jgi:hypothetical protein
MDSERYHDTDPGPDEEVEAAIDAAVFSLRSNSALARRLAIAAFCDRLDELGRPATKPKLASLLKAWAKQEPTRYAEYEPALRWFISHKTMAVGYYGFTLTDVIDDWWSSQNGDHDHIFELLRRVRDQEEEEAKPAIRFLRRRPHAAEEEGMRFATYYVEPSDSFPDLAAAFD